MQVQGTQARAASNYGAARSAAQQLKDSSSEAAQPRFDASSSNGHLLSLLDQHARRQLSSGQSSPQDAAVSAFQQQFADAAGDAEAFHALMQQAFGANYDRHAAEAIRQQTLNGDFSWMPDIEVVAAATLADQSGTQGGGSALAAYDSANDRILLSEELLAGDPARALAILGEEVGHALDARLNTSDSAGDEGDIFSQLLAGEDLSAEELDALRAENDSGTIVVDGQTIEVEYGWLSDAWDSATDFVSDTVESVTDFVSDTVESVGDFVSDTVNDVGDAINDGIEWVNDNVVTPGLEALGPVGTFVNDHIVQPGIGLVTTGVNMVTNTVDTIVDTTTHVVTGAVNFVGNLAVGDLSGAWSSLVQTGQNLASDLGGWVVETGALGLHGLSSFLNGTFGLAETRPLNAAEIQYLQAIYGDSIDYSNIQVQQGGGIEEAIGMRPHAVGNDIFMPDWAFNPDGTLTQSGLELLSHEVAHVWQFQNDGAGYISEAIYSYIDDEAAAYDYQAAIDTFLPWSDMTPDQQAELARIVGMALDHNGGGQLTAADLHYALAHDQGFTDQQIADAANGLPSPAPGPLTPAEFAYFQQIQQNLLSGEV